MGNWLKNFLESQKLSCSVSGKEGVETKILEQKNLIFISVPISDAPKVILDTVRQVKKSTVLIDLSSSQMEITKVLRQINNPSACLHFLFGPSVTSIKNQKVVLNIIKENKKIIDLKILLEKEGARVFEMDEKDHDLFMAYIQNLTHFANIALAKTYIDNKLKLDGNVSTPNSLAQLAVLSSIISQPTSLVTEIQLGNKIGEKVIEDFLLTQKNLINLIKEDKKDEFKKVIERIHQSIDATPKVKNSKSKLKKNENIKVIGKLGYLGPEGTFSNQAALNIASKNQLVACDSIYQIFEMVNNGKIDLGIVPAENTTEGTVRETLDFLIELNLKTVGFVDLNIYQNLLSNEKTLKDIKIIYSHPQALAQCRYWISQNLPNAKVVATSSTVSAIAEKMKEVGSSFIAPELAAKLNNIKVLQKNIEDNHENITKFYIISKKLNPLNQTKKTLLFLTVFNRVGILRDILNVFASNNINLTKIESRPSKEKVWDYHFFIEVEISRDDNMLLQCLNILKQFCPVIKILGRV